MLHINVDIVSLLFIIVLSWLLAVLAPLCLVTLLLLSSPT